MADTVDTFISACLNYIKVKDTDKTEVTAAVKAAAVKAAEVKAAEESEADQAVKAAAAAVTSAEEENALSTAINANLPAILAFKKYTTTDDIIYIKKGGNNEYHAINITTGNAWTVNAKELATATFGGKKSKTHRQKKVHRSTQKRNGRKKTSHRRK